MSHKDERRFEQLIMSLPNVAVQGYDRHRKVIYWNSASETLYGYTQEEAFGQKIEDLIIPETMRQGVIDGINRWIEEGVEIPASELELQRKDGEKVSVLSSHVMLYLDTDEPELFCVDVDITVQRKTTDRLKQLATQDTLTGLPNRRFIEDELERKINEATVYSQRFALFFIDLDHFKEINDTLGHDAGDLLLKQVAERMGSKLRQSDQLSRLGGDEFILLLPKIQDQHSLTIVAERLIAAFESPFVLKDQQIYVTVSIGVCMYPDDGGTVTELFKHADAAMYQAKQAGRNCYRFFSQSMNETLETHRAVTTGLHQAIERQEFSLVYQPQVDLNTGMICSCEALLRWNSAELECNTSPAVFIPIAERSDLILRIGHWVIHEACQQLVKWRTEGVELSRIDINVSGKQLTDPTFIETFFDTLTQYGLEPTDIGIELTEGVLIAATPALLARLANARELGVHFSIDDFGTGYSSLSYLRKFPIETLKVDRSFVREIPNNKKDMAVFEAISQVAQKLGLKVVVEGVENEAQCQFCQFLKCDAIQGYFFYRPLPPSEFVDALAKMNAYPVSKNACLL